MARVSSAITGFNAGELSPKLDSRIDVQNKYNKGCRVLENFWANVQGDAERRKGTVYVAEVKDSTKSTRIIEFIFSDIDSYIIEMGDFYMRFYTTRSQVLSGGSAYEITTPYSESEIFQVKFAQLGDIAYFAHKNHRPYKLSRLGNTNWTFTVVNNQKGPVLDRDPDETINMQASAVTGTGITITASAGTFGHNGAGFEADHVGSVWCFTEAGDSLSKYTKWSSGGTATLNLFYQYEGRLYKCTTAGTFGTSAPTHESGSVANNTAVLEYWNNGTGYARMTARTSATVATFDVQVNLPPTMETGSPSFEASTFWNEGAWSDLVGYPASVAFHEERLCFGGSREFPLAIDMSKSSRRFEDFDTGAGEDDSAMRYTLTGRVNNIQWLKSDGNFLVAGTVGGLSFIGSGSNDEPITPTNVKAKTGANFGSNNLQALELENNLKYIHKSDKKLYQAQYDDLSLKYRASDLTVASEHITGGGIVDMAVTEDPYTALLAVRTDGQIAVFTQNIDQEQTAWSRFKTGLRGDDTFDVVESISVVPSADKDEIWIVVNRNVGGVNKRYIEYIDVSSDDFYVDSGIKYDSVSTTTVSGLAHINNEDVSILADGAVQADQAVTGGGVTLTTAASKVFVGRPYNSDLMPMQIEGGAQAGASQGQPKRIHSAFVRLYKTLGLKVGAKFSKLKAVPFRETSMVMNKAPTLFGSDRAEDKEVRISASWGDEATIAIRQDQPLPATIVGINPQFVTHEK